MSPHSSRAAPISPPLIASAETLVRLSEKFHSTGQADVAALLVALARTLLLAPQSGPKSAVNGKATWHGQCRQRREDLEESDKCTGALLPPC